MTHFYRLEKPQEVVTWHWARCLLRECIDGIWWLPLAAAATGFLKAHGRFAGQALAHTHVTRHTTVAPFLQISQRTFEDFPTVVTCLYRHLMQAQVRHATPAPPLLNDSSAPCRSSDLLLVTTSCTSAAIAKQAANAHLTFCARRYVCGYDHWERCCRYGINTATSRHVSIRFPALFLSHTRAAGRCLAARWTCRNES